MRHWNLYIMNELKEENLLNNYLDIINTLRRFRRTDHLDRRVDRIRIKFLRSTANVNIEYNNNFEIQSRGDQSITRMNLIMT